MDIFSAITQFRVRDMSCAMNGESYMERVQDRCLREERELVSKPKNTRIKSQTKPKRAVIDLEFW